MRILILTNTHVLMYISDDYATLFTVCRSVQVEKFTELWVKESVTTTQKYCIDWVEIFETLMPRHAIFLRYNLKHNNINYMTAVMYQVNGLTCKFVYGMCLQFRA
jgi:hypothetical protein